MPSKWDPMNDLQDGPDGVYKDRTREFYLVRSQHSPRPISGVYSPITAQINNLKPLVMRAAFAIELYTSQGKVSQ